MKGQKSYSHVLSERKAKAEINPIATAIQANTAILLDIKQILLMVADSLLDQEEAQEPTEYLDGSPL